jgi:hypothetical protein
MMMMMMMLFYISYKAEYAIVVHKIFNQNVQRALKLGLGNENL